MAVIHVGIDLGSTQLRAACSAYGDTPAVVTVAGADWPWLLCEPAAGSTVPVSFPSLKSRLGTESTDSGVLPADVLTRALDVVRTGILRESGTSLGQTVISVPTRLSTIARTALLAAAADAGLTDVSLITDSVATVIHQATDVHTGTYLVYGMGYRGYELGLIRAVRGTYRVLGYEGAASPGGATLDALVLGSWLAALRQHGAIPNGTYRGGADWPRLRQLAEQVKLRLAAGESVLFPQAVAAPGGELHVKFEQSSFNRQVHTMLTGTLDRIAALLERTELNAAAVDFITLSGGSTNMPTLREAVSSLGRPIAIAEDNHIAVGALRHAHQLGRRPTSTYDEPFPPAEPQKTDQTPNVSPLDATVLTAPSQTRSPTPAQQSSLDNIRQLIDNGHPDAARTELRTLITEAQAILDELDAPRQQTAGPAGATELIGIARKRLNDGDHRNAIAIAHMAWREAPHDVDVFEEMLDLHCAAAMTNPTTASFEDDERWLRCALHHDPTNARIRRLLAERNHQQAKDQLRAGNRDEARRALSATLNWAPDHPEATAQLRELDQRRT